MATMIPRTVNAAEAQGKDMSQTQHIADQNAVQFQQQTEQEIRQTVETQETETEDFDGDGNGGAAGRQNSRRKKKKQEEPKMAPRSNSSFDITI
jgi:hypothetical protein